MIQAIETRRKASQIIREVNGYRFRSSIAPKVPRKKMSHGADCTGKRFGRLLVIECLGIANRGHRWWGCTCDCGVKVAVRSRELLRGHTRSCGCLAKENRAKRPGQNKLPYGHASRNELLASYKKSARDRDIGWMLRDDEFVEIVSSCCVYCGTPPDTTRKPNKQVNGEFVYSGIDRVDNSRGYERTNSVPCCWNCNRAKGRLGLTEFLAWCSRLNGFAAARSARFEHGESGAPK